jgi:hypothetical protein
VGACRGGHADLVSPHGLDAAVHCWSSLNWHAMMTGGSDAGCIVMRMAFSPGRQCASVTIRAQSGPCWSQHLANKLT